MSLVFLLQLRFSIYIQALIVLVYFAGRGLLDSRMAAISLIVPFCTLVLVSPGSWRKGLPFSRQKLVYLNVIESFLAYLICLASALLIFSSMKRTEIEIIVLGTGISLGLVGLAVRLIIPYFDFFKQLRAQNTDFTRGRDFYIRLTGVGLIGIPIAFLEEELWFFATFLLALAIAATLVPFAVYSMPWGNLKLGMKRRIAVFLVLVFVIFGVNYHSLLSSDIKVSRFNRAQNFVSTLLPVPIDKDRLVNIIAEYEVDYGHLTASVAEDARTKISFEQWKKRTLKCTRTECLDLSDSIQPTVEEPGQKLDRLNVLFNGCQLKESGCSGFILSDKRLVANMDWLIQSGQYQIWLTTGTALQKFVAIQSLASSPKIEELIQFERQLKEDESAVVRNALSYATNVLINKRKACQAEKIDCPLPNRTALLSIKE